MKTRSFLLSLGVLIALVVLLSFINPNLAKLRNSLLSSVLNSDTPASLQVLPSSVTLGYGQSAQFTATATWNDGSTTTPTVSWEGHCGTITASGLYTASSNCGPVTVPVYATLNGVKSSAQIIIQATSNSTNHEPVVGSPTPSPTPVPTTPISPTPSTLAAAFSVSCVNLTCALDASASTGSINSYTWNFGKYPDGTGSGQKVSTSYPHEGSRTVVLTVSDSSGQTKSLSKTFSVSAPITTPTTPPTTAPSTKFRVGDVVQTTSNLNVRTSPSLSGSLVSTISSGTQGNVIGGPTVADGYTWWQINFTNGTSGWGAENYLSASSGSTPIPTPPPLVVIPAPTTLGPHPRVWMTPSRITMMQGQVAANSTRWQNVKRGADAQVARGSAVGSEDANLLPDLCLAYLSTNDARYATRAGIVLTSYAVESNDLKYDSGYGIRFALPLVSMALDWCYNGLTVPQRQQTATWLMNRADWTWPESTPSRLNLWGTNDPSVNYWWGFLMTGPAALAAAGDDTGVGPISGVNRPLFHTQLALNKWTQIAIPYTDNGGGAWGEGTGYDNTNRMSLFWDAFNTSGVRLDTTFLAASLRWRIASVMPGNLYKVPFGAQPRVSDSPVFIYDRMAVLSTLPVASSGLRGEMQTWLDAIGQVPVNEFNEGAAVANEFLSYDPSVVATPIAEPKAFYAQKPGFFIYRQSRTDPNTTAFTFESGPTSNAGSLNANGLMIWKGAYWISATANITSASGIEVNTQNYNNLLINTDGNGLTTGPGQYNRGNNGGVQQTPIVTDSMIVLRAQAKNTYGYVDPPWSDTRFVDDYFRTLVYLPAQDAFIIVDRIAIKDGTKTKTELWQSRNPAVIAGKSFTLASPRDANRCGGQVLYPADAVLGTRAFNLGDGGALSSNAVTVTLPPRATDVVVTVLQCSALSPTSAVVTGTEARVTVGSRTVQVPISEYQAVTVQ